MRALQVYFKLLTGLITLKKLSNLPSLVDLASTCGPFPWLPLSNASFVMQDA